MPAEYLRREGMAAGSEAFLAVGMHVLVRFGRWEEILAAPLPADPELYAATTATMRYARAVAHASLGRVPEAEHEERALAAACAKLGGAPPLLMRRLHNNDVRDMLAVARKVRRATRHLACR